MSGDEVRVVAESLIEASRAVTAVVDAVPGRYIEGLASVHTGHPRLQTVLGDFTARWQEGVDALVGDSLDIAASLKTAAENYIGMDLDAAALFLSLYSGQQP